MNKSILALRAITATYCRDIIKPVLFIVVAVLVCLYALTFYIGTNIHSGWWLLLLLLLPLTIVAAVIFIAVWSLTKVMLPRALDKHEQAQIRQFTNKVASLLEKARMPYPFVIAMVFKDLITRRRINLIHDTITSSKSLQSDFRQLQDYFS